MVTIKSVLYSYVPSLQPCIDQFSEIQVEESSRTDTLLSFETASFILMHLEIAEIKKISLKQEM